MCKPVVSLTTFSPAMRGLIKLIRLKKDLEYKGEKPFVLFLGNGASISSGVPPWGQIIDEIVEGFMPSQVMTHEEKLQQLWNILDNYLNESNRALELEKYVLGKHPSRGYACLAQLVKNGFFDSIFSTNFDPYLEDSLMDAGLRTDGFTKLIVGVFKEEEILKGLMYPRPKIKIVKLHGDLGLRHIAVTREQTFQFHEEIEDALKTYFTQHDVIIFGHSMRDNDLTRCIERKGGLIWYVNPSKPKPDDFIAQAMATRRCAENTIDGDEARFDNFFCALASEVGLPLPPLQKAHYMVENEYLQRRVTIPYLTQEGMQRKVDCYIKETSPSTTIDFGDYVKLKVTTEFGHCPRCPDAEQTPINYSFEVGWSDKFTGYDPIACKRGHLFLVGKNMKWMLDRIQ